MTKPSLTIVSRNTPSPCYLIATRNTRFVTWGPFSSQGHALEYLHQHETELRKVHDLPRRDSALGWLPTDLMQVALSQHLAGGGHAYHVDIMRDSERVQLRLVS